MRIPDTIARCLIFLAIENGERQQTKRARGFEKKKGKKGREREGEGNEARVRHVPEARTMSLCRREPAEPQGLLPLPACNTRARRRRI